MERYDIAIIGTGPGGLEAAITAKQRNKKIILFGNMDLSLKIKKAVEINNYLGLPRMTGDSLYEAYSNHLKAAGISITETRINAVYAMGDYFVLQSAEEMFEANAVIISTGVVTGKTFPGEEENLGRGVSYCATCDAALYKGKTAIVVAYSSKEEKEAEFLAERAEKVYYMAMYKEKPELHGNIELIIGTAPKEIEKNGEKMRLITDKGFYEADGIFVLRDALAPDKLVPGLITEGAHIVTDRSMRTNIEGLFACGDITGKPYQYIKAAGEGNIAALSAAAYLDVKRKSK